MSDVIRVDRVAYIRFEDISIEAIRTQDGGSYLSKTDAFAALGYSAIVKNEQLACIEEVSLADSDRVFPALTLRSFLKLLLFESMTGNERAALLMEMFAVDGLNRSLRKTKDEMNELKASYSNYWGDDGSIEDEVMSLINYKESPAKDNTEQKIQYKMARALKGAREVNTPAGSIDVLTQTEIIEIKVGYLWKSGLGQLIAYSTFYPNHAKRLHLFKVDEKIINAAQEVCDSVGVALTWE